MTHQRAHDHDHDHGAFDPGAARGAAAAPGRASRSAGLIGPAAPVPSGIVLRRRDADGVADGAEAAVAGVPGGPGGPLPAPLMRRFEASLGTDLSSVRVHTGGESAAAARAVGARAYALGQDIHFGAGQYDPASAAGQHLIAHEVAHTVQQRGGSPVRRHKLEVSSPGDAVEVEADRAADAMVRGEPARVAGAPGGVARIKDLAEAADRGEAAMDEAARDPQVAATNVKNVEDKATASQLLGEIRSHDGDVKKGVAEKQIEPSVQIANSACEDLLADYLDSAVAQTAQIDTFRGLFGMFMKDFGRLSEMMKQFDGAELAKLKDPAAAAARGGEQAKEIFGDDDAQKETARIEKLDPAIKTRIEGMKLKKEQLASSGKQVIGKTNDLAGALSAMSNKQREFLARVNAVTNPAAQQALQDAKLRAQHDYSDAAGKVLKDALMGAVTAAPGGPGAAAAAGAKAAGKSAWSNVVAPQIAKALEGANISVGAFPDNRAEADNLEQEKAVWQDVQAKASAIAAQGIVVRQKTDEVGTQFTQYQEARDLYENEMIQLGQDMDKLAKVGRGPMPKDPCVCDPDEKPQPPPKDKGPRYETVMQFLAEADRFTAQADVVKKQGEDELKVTAGGINSASQAHAKLVKATQAGDRPSAYYSVNKLEVTRKDGTKFTKLTAIRHPFRLHNGLNPSQSLDGGPSEDGRYGSAEGGKGFGANQAIEAAIHQVDGAKAKIAAYRDSLASAVGL
jgi:hypothetical protein